MTNKIFTMLAVPAMALIGSAAIITTHEVKNPIAVEESRKEAQREGQEALGYVKYMRQKYTGSTTGEYDIDAIAKSRKALEDFRANAKGTRAFPALSWVERGPNDVGGRLRGMIIDKNNSNKILIATAGGGLFVSSDGGTHWKKHPQSDTLSSMQGSSIAQSVNGDIYFATGEGYSNFGGVLNEGGSSLPGDGIFKSTDGGVTFSQLTSTKPATNSSSGWAYIMRVVCHPTNNDIVYAGTSGGLKKSINGGTSWTNVNTGISGGAAITDLEILPNGNMVVGTTSGIYTSSDGGASFANRWGATGSGLPTTAVSRMEAAFAPSNPSHLYLCAINNTNSGLMGFYQSTDFGATWTTIINGGGNFEPFGTPPPNSTNQGFWGVAMAVNPTNENEFFTGGMQDLYRYNPTTLFKSMAYWQGSQAFGTLIHSDIHYICFDPANGNRMFVCTDGGIYRTFNSTATQPVFAEQNDGLNCLQTLEFAANNQDKLINGSQDNGTNMVGYEGNSPLASRSVYGGDGGICALSDIFSEVAFGSTSYRSDMARSISSYHTYSTFHTSSGAGNSIYDANVDNNADGRPDDQAGAGAMWNMPMDYKEAIKGGKTFSVMAIATLNDIWVTQFAANPAPPIWFKLYSSTNARFTDVTMSEDGKFIFASTNNGAIIRIKGLNLFDTVYNYNVGSSGAFNSTGIVAENLGVNLPVFITSLANSREAAGDDLIVTSSTYGGAFAAVHKISNCRGAVPLTLTNITNNLPAMPVNSAAYVPVSAGSTGKNRIVLGTESGIWGSDNSGTTWVELNNMDPDFNKWHPRVPTNKVIIKNISGYTGPVIYTGTHGRGMFTSYSLASKWPVAIDDVTKNETFSIYPNPAQNTATLNLQSAANSKAIIDIYSHTGAKVKSINTLLNAGANAYSIDVSSLATGTYIVKVISNGNVSTSKLIKQ